MKKIHPSTRRAIIRQYERETRIQVHYIGAERRLAMSDVTLEFLRKIQIINGNTGPLEISLFQPWRK